MHFRNKIQSYISIKNSRLLFLTILLVASLLATGCVAPSGSNAPIDWAAEMHYTQSFRSQEPPRLYGPDRAVPTTGREIIRSKDEYALLTNPMPENEINAKEGAELFRINCSMCHGSLAKGDGQVGKYLELYDYLTPPNLTDQATTNKSDGELAEILANGIYVMPSFRNLLKEDERWLIISHVRSLQGR
jgi:hypothetical protein